jgi:hypothetical protein
MLVQEQKKLEKHMGTYFIFYYLSKKRDELSDFDAFGMHNYIRFSFPPNLMELMVLISSDIITANQINDIDVISAEKLWRSTFERHGGSWEPPNFSTTETCM